MIRDDLSDKLIHLAPGSNYDDAANVFSAILEGVQLVGGTGCIKGGYRCVCFSEAPLRTCVKRHDCADIHSYGKESVPLRPDGRAVETDRAVDTIAQTGRAPAQRRSARSY